MHFLFLLCLFYNFDKSFGEKSAPNPQQNSNFQQIPSNVLSVLPKDVATQLEAIQKNGTLTVHEKAEQIDQIMTEQPSEVLDKIPDPPNFGTLPMNAKNHIKQILRQKGKSLDEKEIELAEYVQSLQEDNPKKA
ncbi:hypothetical protein niasHT_017749 [Heterodera trifolii]|uniref:SXP/RAL-2 family protein Ani s 5-like cation-binding domain-containing protein n=1 Tax=Heterodera trifolii TaxID=157864 RepID=A0ABD2LKB9_9BILA